MPRLLRCWGVVVVVVAAVGVARVYSQQAFGTGVSSGGPQLQQLLSPSQDPTRLAWLVNVLRVLEQNGSLQQLLRKEIHDADASIPQSLVDAIVQLVSLPHEVMTQEAAHAGGLEGYYGDDYKGDYKDYDDDSSDSDSSDDDSSDEDSSDDDSSDDYKHHSHHKHHRNKHHKKHKCKCKKHKKKKKDKSDESNVFSKIRGVNIGSTFANIQITGGNTTSPETPSPSPSQGGGGPNNFFPGFNNGWGPGGPGGLPPFGGLPPGSPLSGPGGGGPAPGNGTTGSFPMSAPSANNAATTEAPTTEAPTTPTPTTEAPATEAPAPTPASETTAPNVKSGNSTADPADPPDPPTPVPTQLKPVVSGKRRSTHLRS